MVFFILEYSWKILEQKSFFVFCWRFSRCHGGNYAGSDSEFELKNPDSRLLSMGNAALMKLNYANR